MRLRLSISAGALVLLTAVLVTGAWSQGSPRVTGVDPASGKVGANVTVQGENLGKGNVSAVSCFFRPPSPAPPAAPPPPPRRTGKATDAKNSEGIASSHPGGLRDHEAVFGSRRQHGEGGRIHPEGSRRRQAGFPTHRGLP